MKSLFTTLAALCLATGATQTITSFTFAPLPTLASQRGANTVVLSWPGSVGGFVLQSSAALVPPTWQTDLATVTLTAGQYQATVPSSTGAKFYRLNLP